MNGGSVNSVKSVKIEKHIIINCDHCSSNSIIKNVYSVNNEYNNNNNNTSTNSININMNENNNNNNNNNGNSTQNRYYYNKNGYFNSQESPPPQNIPKNVFFSSFDKVDIPPQFLGKTFGLLFRSLYETEGVIVIALYRFQREQKKYQSHMDGNNLKNNNNNNNNNNNSNNNYQNGPELGVNFAPKIKRKRLAFKDQTVLASVTCCPDMNMIVLLNDEIFILRAAHRHL